MDREHVPCFASLCFLRVESRGSRDQSGFALVITVVLLALLVLAVYSLSALGRVGADVSATGAYQTQARQHALLGLSQAIGDLHRYAGEQDMLTGTAGVTGLPAGGGQPARAWTAVWDGNGRFFRWLASGAEESLIPALNGSDTLALVGSGSLGADGTDREHVRVRLEPVMVSSRAGPPRRLGRYAWWAGDEGVKLSALVPNRPHAIDELIDLAPDAPALGNVLSHAQISLVPSSVTPTALTGQLRANFHALGLTHVSASGATPVAGLMNLNTTNHRFWRGVAATYNRLKPGSAPMIAPVAFADALLERLLAADPGAGKAEGGPYPSVDLFLNSTALIEALTASGGSLIAFGDVMRPWLAVRSDTFRVRAYGDSVNPADPGRIEATAWCEAIVQRVRDDPTSAEGRFIITTFRWLGPDDI